MTGGAAGLLLLHVSYVGWGLALLRGTARAAGWRLGLLAPLAWLAGVLTHVVALLALLALRIAGGDPARFGDGAAGFRAATWGLVTLGVGLGLTAGGRAWREALARRRTDPVAAARERRAAWPLLLAAPPALLVAISLVGLPDTAYDSVAFWNVKAEVLLRGQGLDAPEFTDPRRVHANPSYPLARPLFTAEQYVALGRADDLGAKPAYLLQLAAGLALLFALLRSEAGTRAAALALALLAWTPILAARGEPGSPDTTYVDLPLGLAFAAALGFGLAALRRRRGVELVGLALVAGLAVLLKDEARLYVGLLVTATAVAGWIRLPHGERRWLLVLLGPCALALGWKALAAGLAPVTYLRPPTPRQLLELPALAPRIAGAVGGSLVDLARWGLLGPLVVGLLAAGLVAARRRAEALLGLVPLAQLAAACAGLGLLEIQKGGFDNWMAHAWDRFLLQLVPGALLVGLALLARRKSG